MGTPRTNRLSVSAGRGGGLHRHATKVVYAPPTPPARLDPLDSLGYADRQRQSPTNQSHKDTVSLPPPCSLPRSLPLCLSWRWLPLSSDLAPPTPNTCSGDAWISRQSQCVLVTGESGAGKTETAKHLLQFMTIVSPASSRAARAGRSVETVKAQLINSSPLLEAFGNAKTVRAVLDTLAQRSAFPVDRAGALQRVGTRCAADFSGWCSHDSR